MHLTTIEGEQTEVIATSRVAQKHRTALALMGLQLHVLARKHRGWPNKFRWRAALYHGDELVAVEESTPHRSASGCVYWKLTMRGSVRLHLGRRNSWDTKHIIGAMAHAE